MQCALGQPAPVHPVLADPVLRPQFFAHVVGLVRDWVHRSRTVSDGILSRIDVVRGELEDLAFLERVLNEYEIETVFHLGAQTIVGTANRGPVSTFESHIRGTWNLLEAARRTSTVGRVVVEALKSLDRGGVVAINAIHLDRIPEFRYEDLWLERQIRSVANFTKGDADEFLRLAAEIPIRTVTQEYALADANRALLDLKQGSVHGAAVLRA